MQARAVTLAKPARTVRTLFTLRSGRRVPRPGPGAIRTFFEFRIRVYYLCNTLHDQSYLYSEGPQPGASNDNLFQTAKETGTMNERELIQRAKEKDRDAFCDLYDLYRIRLYRYAYYRLDSAEDAEDAVSDCILSAWKQIGELRDPDAFSGWIFRILHGCCAKAIQARIRKRESETAVKENKADPASAEILDSLALREALQQLSEEDRSIVLLSTVAGFTSREIGEMTGLAPGSVRSRLSRDLKKMRSFLEE